MAEETYAVLGAGGPTGRLVVEQLLEAGKKVKAIVRNPQKYEDVWSKSPKLEIIKGDVTDPSSLSSALQGAKGIVFAASGKTYFSAKSVDFQGVKNTAEIAEKSGAHVSLVTSALVTPKNRFNPIRILLNNIRYSLMDHKFAGEQALRQSGAKYTVIRPAGLTNAEPGKGKIVIGQADKGGVRSIPRADVARVVVASLFDPKAADLTFDIHVDASQPANSIDNIFDGLQKGVYE